jgi:hypothetical protein
MALAITGVGGNSGIVQRVTNEPPIGPVSILGTGSWADSGSWVDDEIWQNF